MHTHIHTHTYIYEDSGCQVGLLHNLRNNLRFAEDIDIDAIFPRWVSQSTFHTLAHLSLSLCVCVCVCVCGHTGVTTWTTRATSRPSHSNSRSVSEIPTLIQPCLHSPPLPAPHRTAPQLLQAHAILQLFLYRLYFTHLHRAASPPSSQQAEADGQGETPNGVGATSTTSSGGDDATTTNGETSTKTPPAPAPTPTPNDTAVSLKLQQLQKVRPPGGKSACLCTTALHGVVCALGLGGLHHRYLWRWSRVR